MAEEKKVVDKNEAPEKPRGGGKKLVIIVIVLLLLVGGGAAAYVMLMGHNASEQAAGAQASTQAAPPVFAKLDTFVVNLAGPSGTLLQVDIEAELAPDDKNAQQSLTDYMPKVRSAVILLMSAKTPDELATEDGKLKLKSQIKQVINGAINGSVDDPVKNVLFTSFIIQNP